MISIAMTTYNGEKYIREQINSILEQTYQDFELIICDDCSNDSTWNILQEYERKDKRIHCYLNSKNIGFKKNFEKAISLTKGKYIALADQDDIWLSNHLEILLKHIGNYYLVCTCAEIIDTNGKKTGILMRKNEIKNLNDNHNNLLLFKIFYFYNYVQGCTIMFDRFLLNDFIPIPEDVPYHDYWFGIIATMYKKIFFIDEITVLYRQHNSNASPSISRNNKRKYTDEAILLRQIMLKCFLESFSFKMTNMQLKICTDIFQYQQRVINNEKIIERIIFLICNYIKIYHDQSIIKFLPRIILNGIIIPILTYKELKS